MTNVTRIAKFMDRDIDRVIELIRAGESERAIQRLQNRFKNRIERLLGYDFTPSSAAKKGDRKTDNKGGPYPELNLDGNKGGELWRGKRESDHRGDAVFLIGSEFPKADIVFLADDASDNQPEDKELVARFEKFGNPDYTPQGHKDRAQYGWSTRLPDLIDILGGTSVYVIAYFDNRTVKRTLFIPDIRREYD